MRNVIHEVDTLISFKGIGCVHVSGHLLILQLLKHLLIKVCLLALCVLELVPVHATTEFLRHLLQVLSIITTFNFTGDAVTESVDLALFGVVEVRKLDWELESENQLICLVLDGFGQINKVLEHNKTLLSIIEAHAWESF